MEEEEAEGDGEMVRMSAGHSLNPNDWDIRNFPNSCSSGTMIPPWGCE